MKVSIIKIGNSKGLRLSKEILKRYSIKDEVELVFEEGHILLKPLEQPRAGWENAIQRIREDENDPLLIDDVFDDEDFEEWK